MGFMDDLKKLAKPYAEDDDDFDEFDDDVRPSRASRGSSAPAPKTSLEDLGLDDSSPRFYWNFSGSYSTTHNNYSVGHGNSAWGPIN